MTIENTGAAAWRPAAESNPPGAARQPVNYGAVAAGKSEDELRGAGASESEITRLKGSGQVECATCASRRYVDGSNDPGVSFKSPTVISPQNAASAVFSHEREHFSREASRAKEEGRKVVSNNIRVFTSICPECGKVYVSGGETRTVTKKMENSDSFRLKDYAEKIGAHFGKKVDERV